MFKFIGMLFGSLIVGLCFILVMAWMPGEKKTATAHLYKIGAQALENIKALSDAITKIHGESLEETITKGRAPAVDEAPAPSKPVQPAIKVQPLRQIFWGPFQTRISAAGFAQRLEKLTLVNMDIIEKGPAKFMIAFEYQDDTQREHVLEQIREKAGIHIGDENI